MSKSSANLPNKVLQDLEFCYLQGKQIGLYFLQHAIFSAENIASLLDFDLESIMVCDFQVSFYKKIKEHYFAKKVCNRSEFTSCYLSEHSEVFAELNASDFFVFSNTESILEKRELLQELKTKFDVAKKIAFFQKEGIDVKDLFNLFLNTKMPTPKIRTAKDVKDEYLAKINSQNGKLAGVLETASPFVKNVFGHLNWGAFYLLMAYPGVGKTNLMLDLIHTLTGEGHKCGVFSLEMHEHAVLNRLAMRFSGLSQDALFRVKSKYGENSDIYKNSFEKWLGGFSEISHIDNNLVFIPPPRDEDDFYAKLESLHVNSGINVFFIDYMQLLKGKPRKHDSQLASEDAIILSIQRFVNSYSDVIVFGLAQYGKSGEKDTQKKIFSFPKSDVKGSANYEHAVHAIIHMYIDKDSYDLFIENKNNINFKNKKDLFYNIIFCTSKDRVGNSSIIADEKRLSFYPKTLEFRECLYGGLQINSHTNPYNIAQDSPLQTESTPF